MKYGISNENGFLKAELLDRETADETRKFLQSVVLASINIFGGFIVTHRMLSMFKKKPVKK